MLIFARTSEKNEVVCTGKSWQTTSELRDSKLGPQVASNCLGNKTKLKLDKEVGGVGFSVCPAWVTDSRLNHDEFNFALAS